MIRKMKPSDIEQIVRLWLEGNIETHSFISAEYWKSNAPLVQEQLLEAEVYVYEENGIIQGFSGMQGNYLAGIFIKKSVRSTGIGKQLLDHLKEIHTLLFLKVYQENRRAIAFYQREGLIITNEGLDEDTGHREYTMTWERHIRIRPYQDADFADICKIHDPARQSELAFAGLADAFLPLSIAAEREGLFDYHVYVAEYDGIVTGFIAFSEDEIAWLYVDTNYSRRGIGTSLLRYAMQFADEEVGIEVLAGNCPAIALYSSLGFVIEETLTGKMPGNEEFPVTVHVMKKPDEKSKVEEAVNSVTLSAVCDNCS